MYHDNIQGVCVPSRCGQFFNQANSGYRPSDGLKSDVDILFSSVLNLMQILLLPVLELFPDSNHKSWLWVACCSPVPKASNPFSITRNDENRRKEKANDQIEKFYEIFRDLSFEISFTDALMLMPNPSIFQNVICEWAIPLHHFEPIVFYCLSKISSFGDSDFLLMEEADSFLALEDDPTSSEVDPTYQDPEGDILILEAILNSEPPPPTSQIIKIYYAGGGIRNSFSGKLKRFESSDNETPEVEIKDRNVHHHLEYGIF
ncbi:hypothetical protein Tco_0157810 [Tanacetum coccineum]